MKIHLTLKSANAKTGPIPVSTSSAATCPDACPFKAGGCYAKGGPLALHWAKVTSGERGLTFDAFCDEIKSLPDGQLWRHNQAGDLAGDGDNVDCQTLRQLVNANEGKRGFTYTHKPLLPHNLLAIREANNGGFTVNLSANNPTHADELLTHGLPVCTVLPANVKPQGNFTPNGAPIVVCPAITGKKANCAECGLCQSQNRKFVIGFPAHGASHKKASNIASL